MQKDYRGNGKWQNATARVPRKLRQYRARRAKKLMDGYNGGCVLCHMGMPTSKPRVCPFCRHEFRHGWTGANQHWKLFHSEIISFEDFQGSLCKAHGRPRQYQRQRIGKGPVRACRSTWPKPGAGDRIVFSEGPRGWELQHTTWNRCYKPRRCGVCDGPIRYMDQYLNAAWTLHSRWHHLNVCAVCLDLCERVLTTQDMGFLEVYDIWPSAVELDWLSILPDYEYMAHFGYGKQGIKPPPTSRRLDCFAGRRPQFERAGA